MKSTLTMSPRGDRVAFVGLKDGEGALYLRRFDSFEAVTMLMGRRNRFAQQVLASWAEAEWFTSRPELPDEIRVRIFKVEGGKFVPVK